MPDNRFSKDNRLRKSVEFDRVFKNGTKVVTPVLVFFWKPSSPAYNQPGQNRLGLVVSRKVGNAIRRNRIKRMIREAFRLVQHTLFSSVDLVVIPRYGAIDRTLAEYKNSFLVLSRRMNR